MVPSLNELPPMPQIKSDTLRQEVYTHPSYHGRSVRGASQDTADVPPPDNQSLEHLGDSVLNFCVTVLIRRLYPRLTPGKATIVRSCVVDNKNLAKIATRYEFSAHLLVHPSAPHVSGNLKAQADAFEAYVGGLYEEQGLEIVRGWFDDLFTPHIHCAYERATSTAGPCHGRTTPASSASSFTTQTATAHPSTSTEAPEGRTAELHERMTQKGQAITWKYVNIAPGANPTHPEWEARAYMGDVCIGIGRASTKRVAKNNAAHEGLRVMNETN